MFDCVMKEIRSAHAYTDDPQLGTQFITSLHMTQNITISEEHGRISQCVVLCLN